MSSDEKKGPPTGPEGETFAKRERLLKTKDFRKVYQAGRSFKAGGVIMKVSPNAAVMNRVGFSISAKSIKRAFKRNRIKRLFREAYRKNKNRLKKGFDIVFVVRQEMKRGSSYKEAEAILLNLSKQAGILL